MKEGSLRQKLIERNAEKFTRTEGVCIRAELGES